MNNVAGVIVRGAAMKWTGDKQLAEDADKAARMTEKVYEKCREGAIMCARKYAVSIEYAPELILGAGLLGWLGALAAQVKMLREIGKNKSKATPAQ